MITLPVKICQLTNSRGSFYPRRINTNKNMKTYNHKILNSNEKLKKLK